MSDDSIPFRCIVGKRALGDLYPQSFRRSDIAIPKELQARAPVSTDGTCGRQAGGAICDPNATGYKGTCCSEYGYCGNTEIYCGTGCQSGCTTPAPPPPPTGGGGGTFRPDGRCGLAEFGGATCAGSPYGTCCSSYGYCGNTDGHCGAGCLNGCNGGGTNPPTPTNPPTSSSSQEPVLGKPTNAPVTGGTQTPDGSCGLQADGKTSYICGNWPQGGCCSAYGVCTMLPISRWVLILSSSVVGLRPTAELVARAVLALLLQLPQLQAHPQPRPPPTPAPFAFSQTALLAFRLAFLPCTPA